MTELSHETRAKCIRGYIRLTTNHLMVTRGWEGQSNEAQRLTGTASNARIQSHGFGHW